MAEDKLLKDKKTKEIKEDIYALDLDFDNNIEMGELSFEKEDDISDSITLKGYEDSEEEIVDSIKLKGYEDLENDEEEPKKKKVLSKIEEGIKSSKRGRGRPRKKSESVAKATTKKKKKEKNYIK